MIDPETGDETSVSRPSKLGIALRRYWPAVIALGVLLAVVAFAASSLQSTTYAATGQVVVSEPDAANNPDADVQTIARLLASDPVLSSVASSQHRSIDSIRGEILATPATGANVIDLTGRAGSAARAVALVRATYTAYQSFAAQLPRGESRATYLAPPTVPTSPTSPRPTRNAGIGFVLGVLVAAGAAWLGEIRRPTAADADLVATTLGAPMFADLAGGRRGRRRGRRAALTALSLDLDELAPKGTRVLCVCAARPRDLAPDLAPGLAAAFAAGGWRTTLVDGDSGAELSRRYAAETGSGLSDLIGSGRDATALLASTGVPGLQLLPYGSRGLDRAQPNLAAELRRVYAELTAAADLVLVVSPRVGLDTEARLVAAAANGTIFVVRESTPVDDVEAARERLTLFQAKIIGFVRDEQPAASRLRPALLVDSLAAVRRLLRRAPVGLTGAAVPPAAIAGRPDEQLGGRP